MSYKDRAIRTGGYFTAALLPINTLFANVGYTGAVTVSLIAGVSFTVASLAVGKHLKLK